MLRVVYVGHSAKLSGAELALASLLPALRDVDPVVVLAEDGPLVGRFAELGIETIVLPLGDSTRDIRKDSLGSVRAQLAPVFSTLSYSWKLSRLIRSLDADLVHTNSLKANLYGGVAAHLARVPQVWHARDRISEDYLPSLAVHVVRFAAAHLPDAVVANSRSTRDTLHRYARPTEVISSPVVYDAVPQNVKHSADNARPFTVGMVGRLSPWKGQDVFVRAFSEAFPSGDARARIVGSSMFGEDAYVAELQALVASLPAADRIDFIGFVEDVPGELAEMDVLVHASTIPEPFGQVVVEGMAAGLAVIASDAGGPAEVVDPGSTGLLTPPGDVAALAEAMRHLHDDPALRLRLGVAAERASHAYAPELIAGQIEAVYRSVLGRR